MSTIKQKYKICKTCGDPCFIFSHGNCKNCAQLIYAKKAVDKRQQTLTQTTDGKTAKPFKVNPPISPISKKRAEALKVYRNRRDNYFKEHPVCEYPGCTSRKITLHHAAGRCGSFLTDKRFFKSLCITHHNWVEANPIEAQKLGLSKKRLDKII
jgi:hypothetical protein